MSERIQIDVVANDMTGGALSGVNAALGNIFQTAMGFLSAQVFQRIGSEIVNFAQGSIKAASDLNETVNKMGAVFGSASEDVQKWAETSANSVGLTKGAAMDAASMMGIFGKSAGLAGDQLADFSTKNIGLAADMASFFNTSVEEASGALQAAFRGETEPIRKYGILLDEASMKQEALAMGLIKNTKEALTPQNKVLAANALIWKQTKDVQGDFAKTSTGLANSQRIFNAAIANAQASLGTIFLPIVNKVMVALNTGFVPALQGAIDAFAIGFGNNGDIITGLSNMLYKFDNISPIFDDLGDAIAGLSPLITMVTDAFNVGFGSNGDIVTGLSNVMYRFDQISPVFDFLGDAIANLPGVFNAFVLSLQPLFAILVSISGHILTIFKPAFDATLVTIQNIAAQVLPWLLTQINKLTDWFIANQPLIEAFAKKLSDGWQKEILPAIQIAVNMILPILDGLFAIILKIGTLIMQVATGDWAGAWATIQGILQTASDAIGAAVIALLDGIAGYFGSSLKQIGDTWGGIGAMFQEIIAKLAKIMWDNVNNFVQAGLKLGQSIIDGIINGLHQGIDAVGAAIMDLLPGGGQPATPDFYSEHHEYGGSASGMTWVGERGPELVRLPSGSWVHTAQESNRMGGGGAEIDYNKLARVIRDAMLQVGR